MKYQNFAVIFVLIILPISIVLSNYIESQSDTLELKTNYQTKLNDSTYDAIAAYQMNSLNTQSVAGESVKSYVLASVNTFFTTLSTNLGMSSASKTLLLRYVPAILFTTYDGYYIYSPTKTYEIATIPSGAEGELDATDAGQAVLSSEGNLVYLKTGTERVTRTGTEEKSVKYADIAHESNDDLRLVTGVTTDPSNDDGKVDYNYMLKPFIYYSATYKNQTGTNNYTVVANYSLDNYLTVYGNKSTGRDASPSGATYVTDAFTKSGYLIDTAKVTLSGNMYIPGVSRSNGIESDGTGENNDYISLFDEEKYEVVKNTVKYEKVDINSEKVYNYINYYDYLSDDASFNYGGTDYYYALKKGSKVTRINKGDELIENTLDIQEMINDGIVTSEFISNYNDSDNIKVTLKQGSENIEITDKDAKEYYIKAYFFTKWVNQNLGDIKESDYDLNTNINIAEIVENEDSYVTSFTDEPIFLISSANDPESDTSRFVDHKKNVIKNSIQSNLNSAISTYNQNHLVENDFSLPVMSYSDWNTILTSVSMVTFMQGFPTGLSTFNGYSVVASNDNNTAVNVSNMYFTTTIDDETSHYHRIDCPELENNAVDIYEGDISSEFKYDARRLNLKIKTTDATEIKYLFDETTYYYPEKIDDTKQATADNIRVGAEVTDTDKIKEASAMLTSSDVKYIYDHKNTACYTCVVGGNYEHSVVYHNGALYLRYTTEFGEDVYYDDGDGKVKFISDDKEYTDTTDPNAAKDAMIANGVNDLTARRKSVLTYMAKKKLNLYKSNAYINR